MNVRFLNTTVIQGSVATRANYGRIFNYLFIANLLLSVMVEEFWRSVRIWQSYGKKLSGTFFFRTRCSIIILVLLVVVICIISCLYVCAASSADSERRRYGSDGGLCWWHVWKHSSSRHHDARLCCRSLREPCDGGHRLQGSVSCTLCLLALVF